MMNQPGAPHVPPSELCRRKLGEIIRGFEALEHAVSNGDSIDTLRKRVGDLIGHSSHWSLKFGETVRVCRTVPLGDGEPCDNLDRLHYPPVEKAKLGRANRDGKRVLYVSGYPITTLIEVPPAPGQRFGMIEYEIPAAAGLNLMHVGIYGSGNNDAIAVEATRLPPNVKARLDSRGLRNLHEIHTRLGAMFTRTDRSMYPASVAIAEIFELWDNGDGLMYPSVREAGSYNLALKVNVADEKLLPIRAWDCRMISNDAAKLEVGHLATCEIAPGSREFQWVAGDTTNAPSWIHDLESEAFAQA
jgi:hypothetical protein